MFRSEQLINHKNESFMQMILVVFNFPSEFPFAMISKFFFFWGRNRNVLVSESE